MKIPAKFPARLVVLAASLVLFPACGKKETAGGSPDLWASSMIQQVTQRRKLVVLMEAEFRPFTYKDKGELKGFDVDLAREIARELKVDVEFRERGFDLLPAELIQGKGDLIISGVTMTPERALSCAFTEPYFFTKTISLLAKPRADGVRTIADLNDASHRIVVQKGSTGENAVKAHLPAATLSTFDREDLCALEVAQGRADAFIYDEFQVRTQAREHAATTRVLDEQLSVEPYAIELRRGDPESRDWLNMLLSIMKRDGRLEALYAKHLPGVEVPPEFRRR
jgi:polar amino acid transport system substrate-binding protein